MSITAEKPVVLSDLSIAELESFLSQKKVEDAKKREASKKAYEKDKNNLIESLYDEANELALMIERFKNKCHVIMDKQAERLKEYGGIRSNSKGGFSLSHSDGITMVTRRRDTDPSWDERATKAVELIKDFLGDTIKKRDLKLHDILMGFLERNSKGDLEYAKVMDLLQHEDKFDDVRWQTGLQLIKESYSQHFKAYGYEFKRKNNAGKWQTLTLNFSSL